MKQRNLRSAVRRGLLPLGIAIALAPAFAAAQEKDATNLDTVQVTGSRIRSADIETQQAVTTITRADIERQGFTNVADILQSLTSAGNPAISRADALASGEAVGGQYVDLRNLGPERTLVLIDGKRMGITSGGYSDLASIPTSSVERIEVLADGASAIYGSDAIAGVINVITRKNFEGLEASAYLGQYGKGDGQKQIYNFLFGTTGERGSITLGGELSKEQPVEAKDRAFSASSMGQYHAAPEIYDGSYRSNGWSATTQMGRLIDQKGKSWTLNPGGDPRNLSDYHVTNRLSDYANTPQQMFLATGLERRSLFANGDYQINDDVKFVADALYTRRETLQQIAGYPYQSAVYDTPLSADSYFNPLGYEADFLRRTWEMPRQTRSRLTTYRFNLGLEGNFEIGDKYWNWDVGYLYNRNEGLKVGTGNLYLPHVTDAVGPSFMGSDGVVRCGAPGAVIDGCVPWNPMAPYGARIAGSLTDNPALQDYLFPVSHGTSDTKTEVFSANIGGTLARWAAGDLNMAFGLEHRKESAVYEPDALDQLGLTTDLSGSSTRGSYSLSEAYLEFAVPLLADKTLAKELSLDVAGRYSDYSTFGDTFNSKIGLKWKPNDDLLVRATYATGFRAPTVDDLWGGTSETFDNLTDPCDGLFGAASRNPGVAARCAADGVPATFRQEASGGVPATGPGTQTNYTYLSGSNPDLTPEESKSYSVGVVWSPSFAEGLNISLDWWKVRIENVIAAETVTSILNQCYVMGNAEACDRFERADGGNKNALKDHQVIDATRTLVNAGFQKTAGYDLSVAYSLPEFSWGKVAISWKSTYVSYLDYKLDNVADTPVWHLNGWSPDDGTGANSRIRSNLNLNWTRGPWGANWNTRYYSGVKEYCVYDEECSDFDYSSAYTQAQPIRKVGSNTFHDVKLYVNVPWDAKISLGVNNVFGHEGPQMYSQPDSSFSYNGAFDIGRFWYMKYEQKF